MENIDFLNIGLKWALGFLGIIIFATWKVREHLREFNWDKFLGDNKAFWIWSNTMVALLLIVVSLSPESADAIKTMLGLDINGEPASFLTLGWGLAIAAHSAVKKKLDKKPE